MQDQNQTGFTPSSLRRMRQDLKLSLKDFWGAVGCTISSGHNYEAGKVDLPEPARRLVHMKYVSGIPTDIDSEEFRKFQAMLTKARLESGINELQSKLTEINHD